MELRATKSFRSMLRKVTIPLQTDRGSYPLPRDYFAPIPESFYNSDTALRNEGPVSDGMWNSMLYRGVSSGGIKYRIFGPDDSSKFAYTSAGQLQVLPVPASSDENLPLEYLSRNLFYPQGWSPADVLAGSTYRFASGMILQASTGTTHASTAPAYQTETYEDQAATITDGTVTWQIVSTPYETPIANTDVSVFDDETMIEGLWVYYLEGSPILDASGPRKKFDGFKETSAARVQGSFVGSMEGPGAKSSRRFGPETEGGWSF